ncbi:MAG: substrate-binding domain-containing protein [Spirochaetales bacterium]|nr:substrate-binding domain-containing protein [Spirochaetales bacterium]
MAAEGYSTRHVRFAVSIILIALLLIASASCSDELGKEGETLRFLYVPGKSNEFYRIIEEKLESIAEQEQIELITPPSGTIETSLDQTNFIEAKLQERSFDLLIISPADSRKMLEPLKEYASRGVRIMTIHNALERELSNGVKNGSIDGQTERKSASQIIGQSVEEPIEDHFILTHIGSDNELGGRLLAGRLAELTNNSGVVYVNTDTANISSETRVKSFHSSISGFPAMRFVGIDYSLGSQEKAFYQTISILQTGYRIKAILGTNEISSLGLLKAVQETGLEGSIKVACWGASRDMLEALREGYIHIILAENPAEMAEKAMNTAAAFFREKKDVPPVINTDMLIIDHANVNEQDLEPLVYNWSEK